MAVAVYVRVSSDEQRERQTIVTQRDFASRYSDLHGLAVYETFADDGVSGTVPIEQRPGGIKLLEAARLRQFDQLLVYKLDRLGRDTRLILNVVAELEKHGVRVKSMTEEFDASSASGRLMLTMLSGFAAHEREVTRERSMAGTNRVAETGAWMGGIIPYGYRKDPDSRCLVVNDEPMPGLKLSQADVIRLIYRLCVAEKKSCQKIADYLNDRAIPCGPVAAGGEAGKRSRRTALVWSASHVRNLIASPTYKGEHQFGKRSKNPGRKVIVRKVPAIVSEDDWSLAQQVLRSNMITSRRNAKHPYLFRGLIKCGFCGLTYSGVRKAPPSSEYYYRCGGQTGRAVGLRGHKCKGKGINGSFLEQLVWGDIESFLRDPGEILNRLRDRLSMPDEERSKRQSELDELQGRFAQKSAERERVLGLFRRGRIDDVTLDEQLDQINTEAFALHAEIEKVNRALSAGDRTAQLKSAEELLATIRARLTGPVPFELKRQIVEVLVAGIKANTVGHRGVPHSEIQITYRFGQPGEAKPLTLPRSHRVGNQMPESLVTVGDHLRQRRLEREMLQREVADVLGVTAASVGNWERNRTQPEFLHIPAIIEFLGYNPLPVSDCWSARLVAARTALGLSQKEAAERMNVDPSTLARWERGEREPTGRFLAIAAQLICCSDGTSPAVLTA